MDANKKPIRTVLDFSKALQTAKTVMKQKHEWEKTKAELDRAAREVKCNDIDEWEIPAENSHSARKKQQGPPRTKQQDSSEILIDASDE